MKKEIEKYNGMKVLDLKHVKRISKYNNNYYLHGLEEDLLFAQSDDDRTTEWYLVKDKTFNFIGYSYSDVQEERIETSEEKQT